MLFTLLLAAASITIEMFLPYTGLLAFCFTIYVFFSNRKKEVDDKTKEFLKKIDEKVNNHDLLHQSHQQTRERLIDTYDMRLAHLEHRVSKVDEVLTRLQNVENKMIAFEVKLENYSDKIKELTAEVKTNQLELIDLIKKQ